MRKTMIVLFLMALLVLSVAAAGCRKQSKAPVIQGTPKTTVTPVPSGQTGGAGAGPSVAAAPEGVDTAQEPQFEDVDVDLGDVV